MGIACCLPPKENDNDKFKNLESPHNKANERRQTYSDKVERFKTKTQEISKIRFRDDERLKIIQSAIADLELTEEPIDRYYTMEKVLGAGKYGVVKSGHSIVNPDFKVAIKTISLQKLTSQFHSIVQEILSLKN